VYYDIRNELQMMKLKVVKEKSTIYRGKLFIQTMKLIGIKGENGRI